MFAAPGHRLRRWVRHLALAGAQAGRRAGLPTPEECVLVLVNGHLTYGNGILLEPALRQLRRALPANHITLVGSGSCASIFRQTPLVDRCIAWDDLPEHWHTDPGSPARLGEFGLVFRAFSPPISFRVELAACRHSRYWTSGDFFPGTFHTPVHETDLTLVPVARHVGIALAAEDRYPVLHLTETETVAGRRLRAELVGSGESRVVGMHVGCSRGAESRRWPVERFAEVARALLAEGRRVVVVGGPDDIADNAKLLSLVPGLIDATNCGTLRETAAFLSHMNCFLTNDSGLMHAANAVGTPVVAIFGPTSEVKSYPLAPDGRATVLKDENCPCRPCYNVRPQAPDECRGRGCLLSIDPPRVLSAVAGALRWSAARRARS